MDLLLDTHVLLWWLGDSRKLPAAARAAIADARNSVAVSAASAWEIAIKRALGKVDAPDDLAAAVAGQGFDALDISLQDASAAGALPRHHHDPFDRMLIAQARGHGYAVVTVDPRFAAYEVVRLPL